MLIFYEILTKLICYDMIKKIRIYFQKEFTIHGINYLLSFLNQCKIMIADSFIHMFICSVLQLK